MSADPPVVSRHFGRCEVAVPPLAWRLVAGRVHDASLLEEAASRGADLCLLDADAAPPDEPGCRWLLGVTVDEAQSRPTPRLLRLLDQLGPRVLALVLQGATTAQVKAGRAVDRLARLRQDRGVPLWCLEAPDSVLDVEWMIENTPAHGVIIRHDSREQSASFRALDSARELGVAVLASPSPSLCPVEEVRFLSADPRVTSVVLPLPESPSRVGGLIQAARSPMSAEQRESSWQAYRAAHPAPRRPRHGHALDE